MAEEKSGMKDMKVNKKAVLIRMSLLLIMYLIVGLCTRVIPMGEYTRVVEDGHKVIDIDSFQFIDGDRLPIWRWFTAPIDAILSGSATTSIVIIISILLMGGLMIILDESKVMHYVITWIISKFGKDKYRLMYILVALMMFLGSVVSFYDSCGIFIPITVGLSFAIGWDSLAGIGMSYLPIALGFSVSTTNPFTIGIPQSIAGLPIYSGIGLRILLLIVIYIVYVLFLRAYCKKLDENIENAVAFEEDKKTRGMFPEKVDFSILEDKQIGKGGLVFMISVLLVVAFAIFTCFVSSLSSLNMYWMTICLVGGGIIAARVACKMPFKSIMKAFKQGLGVAIPSAVVIFIIMGLRQILTSGQIMDTLLYYAYNGINGMNPYLAVFVILGITMAFEFVVSSASTKAFLILPMILPLGNMVGLTSQTIVQAYSFGDSFSNAFYPTSNMLLIISGVFNMPLSKWYKWTWKLILSVIVFVVLSLLLCVAINYGPF